MPIPAISIPCVNNLFEAACLCNNAQVYDNNNSNILDNNNNNSSSSSSNSNKSSSYGNGSMMITGQPTEVAILIAAKRLNILDRRNIYNRLEEVHFTSEMKFMEVIYDHRQQQQHSSSYISNSSSSNSNGSSSSSTSSYMSIHNEYNQQKHYLKGALEIIMPKCVTFIDKNGELALLSVSAKERVLNHSQDMSNKGLRVIAVACGDSNNQLTLCGIIGLMDPLRTGMMMMIVS